MNKIISELLTEQEFTFYMNSKSYKEILELKKCLKSEEINEAN